MQFETDLEFTFFEEDLPDWPSYAEPGRLLVRLWPNYESRYYRWEVDALDCDGCGLLIQEGEGIDFWVNEHLDLEVVGYPATYVIEGITGDFRRGDFWAGEDDDVTWDFALVRRASAEEEATEALF